MISKKGRVGLLFSNFLDESRNNKLEITGYGTINRSQIFGLPNEFSVGIDLFYQAGPVEEYKNINGRKDTLNLIKEKLDILFSASTCTKLSVEDV